MCQFAHLFAQFFSLGRPRASSDCQLRQNLGDACRPPDIARGRGASPTRPPTLSPLSNAQGFHLRPAFGAVMMIEARTTISGNLEKWLELKYDSPFKTYGFDYIPSSGSDSVIPNSMSPIDANQIKPL